MKKQVKAEAVGGDKVDKIIDKYQGDASLLIQVLLEIQRENHWLSKEALEKVSKKLGVPLNRIQHVATFYKAFSLVPKGRHEVQICLGTACHVRGGPRILDRIEEVLGIRAGETTTDMKFTLETVNCLGCCALGPVMVVDGKYHGKIAPTKAEEVLKSCD
ncbi:MAG: NADH-quinone oxidoreductase subunit NuoE [Chloroflexi bacterium]|nr:NADH-quinone oxidoreductase subunit NuoE [Chloroflexota bacterium]